MLRRAIRDPLLIFVFLVGLVAGYLWIWPAVLAQPAPLPLFRSLIWL